MPSVGEIMKTLEYGPSVEDSSAVRAWLDGHGRFGHFIDGGFTAPGAGFVSADPATDTPLAEVTQGSAEDVAAAVAAARAAQPGWAALSGHERARHLYAVARTIQKHERFLAVLETLDNGKPIRESRDIDLPLVVRHFYHHAGWAELLADEFPGRAPHGVVGQVIPWNFPLLMLSWKVAPALAAGNTVVLKPAEYTPLTALALAELCGAAGLPKGVLNVVTGDGETGAALVRSEIDKIAFTGSTEVGRAIIRATAERPRPLTLELGGKSPFVVMEDADLDAAVEGVVDSIWFNQGQVCCAGSRILVAEAVAPRFETLLQARLARMRVGPPLDKSTDVGAIVHPLQKRRITDLCRRAVAEGAEMIGGAAAEHCAIAPGYLRQVTPANPAWDTEIFGPIATLTSFRTADEAVALANNTRYGLAASVWSERATVATDLAARIRAGVVWINAANLFDAAAPFGGMRESGFGREGGRAGLDAYLRPAQSPSTRPHAGDAQREAPAAQPEAQTEARADLAAPGTAASIDRTAKLYIGGAQKRPDAGASYPARGRMAPRGNRKDIRNAVEAAGKATAWGAAGGHARAQVLYFVAENLAARQEEFAAHWSKSETDSAVRRLFHYAAWADKFDGSVVQARPGHLVTTLNEPWGVVGLRCPENAPLAGLVALVAPLVAVGNRVVVLPAQSDPFAAFELAQVFDTSDLPGGVVNIVSGPTAELALVLAEHDDVAALWHAGSVPAALREASTGNLKPVWEIADRDWTAESGQGREFLAQATQIKTIWLPYGALPTESGSSAY